MRYALRILSLLTIVLFAVFLTMSEADVFLAADPEESDEPEVYIIYYNGTTEQYETEADYTIKHNITEWPEDTYEVKLRYGATSTGPWSEYSSTKYLIISYQSGADQAESFFHRFQTWRIKDP